MATRLQIPGDSSVGHAGFAFAPSIEDAKRVPITVVIPTLNESPLIQNAIAALDWADEVIVVDGGSTDSTQELACLAGARTIEVLDATIASQRNAGIAAARNRWVLALDADERVPEDLRAELASIIQAPHHAAYRMRLCTVYLGFEIRHGRLPQEWKVRLFQNDKRFIEQRVHETLEFVGDIGAFRTRLQHVPYSNLTHQLRKMIRYAQWGAEDLRDRQRKARWSDLLLRPAWRFIRDYVIYSGWRDGRHGLVVATVSACSVLMKYAYLFELEWQGSAAEAVVKNTGPCHEQRHEERSS